MPFHLISVALQAEYNAIKFRLIFSEHFVGACRDAIMQ